MPERFGVMVSKTKESNSCEIEPDNIDCDFHVATEGYEYNYLNEMRAFIGSLSCDDLRFGQNIESDNDDNCTTKKDKETNEDDKKKPDDYDQYNHYRIFYCD